jgi:hypothetical protein
VKPVVALPKQFDVRGIVQVALVTSDIHQALIQVGKASFPLVKQYFLQLLNIDMPGEAVADGAYDFPILDRMGRVYGYSAEHQHVQVAVEHFYEGIVRHTDVWLKEHQRYLPFGWKQGLVALLFLRGHPPSYSEGKLLLPDMTQFALEETFTVSLQKIKLWHRQSGLDFGYFC